MEINIKNWIKVEDELPEPSVKGKLNKVLVYSPSTIGVSTGYYWGETTPTDPCKGWCMMGITHWLPLTVLPELPK